MYSEWTERSRGAGRIISRRREEYQKFEYRPPAFWLLSSSSSKEKMFVDLTGFFAGSSGLVVSLE